MLGIYICSVMKTMQRQGDKGCPLNFMLRLKQLCCGLVQDA